MDEPKIITFTHKEVTTALIKHQNIHEGNWQIYIEFGISGANIPTLLPGKGQELQLCPAAIVPINKIGLMKVDGETPLSLDASKVNPPNPEPMLDQVK